jgi:hypothetical protein
MGRALGVRCDCRLGRWHHHRVFLMKDTTKVKLGKVMWWCIIIAVLATGLCAYDTVMSWLGLRDY